MKEVIAVLFSMFIFVGILLLTLLFGHVISYAFGQGWALNIDCKNACAVTGSILGAIGCVAYWCSLSDR